MAYIFYRTARNLFFLFFVATAAFLSNTDIGLASIRPANPVMDYVPQTIGIYDTFYKNLCESDCRVCHGESTAERHHGIYYAVKRKCLFCHFGSSQPGPQHDCKVCHVDGGPFGNLGSPHHRSELAESYECNQCHPNVIAANTVEPPSSEPSLVTPTPYSCENCHWPSGKEPNQASTYEGGFLGIAAFQKDWESWSGLPKPTKQLVETFSPKPIEASGPIYSGILGEKPYRPSSGTHHEIGGNAYQKCSNCHPSTPGAAEPLWDPNDPYLIRFCENCHSINSLHSIPGHISSQSIYTVGGQLNQTVTADEKCIACHGNTLLDILSLHSLVDRPVIDRLEPDFGPSDTIVSIIPASGQCWNDDPVNGLCSFGIKTGDDAVKMGQKDSITDNWYYTDVPVYSWSEHLIKIKIPKGVVQHGRTRIAVYKENSGKSNFKVFTVRKHPAIYSLTPSIGNWGQIINIDGEGLGVKKEKVYSNGFGFSTYVELCASGYNYRVTRYRASKFWDTNMISIILKDLLDTTSGNLVSEHDLFAGDWNVYLVTDYFQDDGDGVYNYGLSGLDTMDNPQGPGTGDKLLQRVYNDPVSFTVTKDPYIESLMPNPSISKETVTVSGSNFGATRGTSIIKLWNVVHKKFSVVKKSEIVSWRNTEIKFIGPPNNRLDGNPKIKDIQIILDFGTTQKKASNFYRLSILSAP